GLRALLGFVRILLRRAALARRRCLLAAFALLLAVEFGLFVVAHRCARRLAFDVILGAFGVRLIGLAACGGHRFSGGTLARFGLAGLIAVRAFGLLFRGTETGLVGIFGLFGVLSARRIAARLFAFFAVTFAALLAFGFARLGLALIAFGGLFVLRRLI